MDYQTILNNAANWFFSDMERAVAIVAGIAIVGVIIGIRRSLDHCRFIGHRRVL